MYIYKHAFGNSFFTEEIPYHLLFTFDISCETPYTTYQA